MDFTHPQLTVLAVAGDLDARTTPRLAELLWRQLLHRLTPLVLDFTKVSFLGVDGLQLLAGAHSYTAHRGITLCLVNNTHTVQHALAAADLDTVLPCFASIDEARAALTRDLAAIPSQGMRQRKRPGQPDQRPRRHRPDPPMAGGRRHSAVHQLQQGHDR